VWLNQGKWCVCVYVRVRSCAVCSTRRRV
jgi:hypothetical protein